MREKWNRFGLEVQLEYQVNSWRLLDNGHPTGITLSCSTNSSFSVSVSYSYPSGTFIHAINNIVKTSGIFIHVIINDEQ
jgi:hypothetical protein